MDGKRISIRNVPIGKTGLPFQNFRLSREFSSGTNHKNVYDLHPNRNFREFVANGKQPIFPTPETIKGMGTSYRHKDFWDHLGGQASLMIGY